MKQTSVGTEIATISTFFYTTLIYVRDSCCTHKYLILVITFTLLEPNSNPIALAAPTIDTFIHFYTHIKQHMYTFSACKYKFQLQIKSA